MLNDRRRDWRQLPLLHAELGEVVAGLKPGRTTAGQITIADLTGVGFQDTAIASRAIELVNG